MKFCKKKLLWIKEANYLNCNPFPLGLDLRRSRREYLPTSMASYESN